MFGWFSGKTEIEGAVTKKCQSWEYQTLSIENPPSFDDLKMLSELGEYYDFELVAAVPLAQDLPSEFDRNPKPRILLFFKKPRP